MNKPEGLDELIANPPAFPLAFKDNATGQHVFVGMTLRDYFAAKAMTNPVIDREEYNTFNHSIDAIRASYAKAAYAMADAMLAERNK